MDTYPPINDVEPKTIFGTRVPRDDDLELPGVTQADTHQLRAIYEFDGLTANIVPEFEKQSDGTWTPYWVVQVYESRLGGGGDEYGPFESVEDAVSHVGRAMSKLV